MEKIVLITGASAGIGEAIARRFDQKGYRLILTARRRDRLMKIKESLRAPSEVIELDVMRREEVEKILAGVGPVDILVNNAGLALGLEPAYRADLDDWEVVIDANIKGLVFCTRILLPGMVERGSGHIINLGSVAGTYPYPGGNVYGATKAFAHQFSLNLRADLLGTGVRVTCVEPGLVGGTEFSQVRFKGDQSRVTSIYENKEPLEAKDIAEAVFWCAAQPPHVNVNTIEIMPTSQAFAALPVKPKQ